MTELQHFLVGYIIFMALWHFWLKRYFITEKDIQRWKEIMKKYF